MRIDINNGWLWAEGFSEEMVKPSYEDSGMETVRIPHTVKVTPLNYFDAHVYQMVSCYRKTISVPYEWKEKKVFITFDAVAHEAEIYVNGVSVARHSCGCFSFHDHFRCFRDRRKSHQEKESSRKESTCSKEVSSRRRLFLTVFPSHSHRAIKDRILKR